MDKEEKKLREEIGSLVEQQEGIVATAKSEKRDLSDEEATEFDSLQEQVEAKKKALNRHIALRENKNDIEANTISLHDGDDEKPAKDVSVNGHKASSERAMNHYVTKIFRAMCATGVERGNSMEMVKEAQKQLFLGGHYDNLFNGLDAKASVDGFNTLLDKDGGIFLPTTISEMIMEIEREYGAFPSNSLRVPLSVGGGRQVIPNVLGKIKFYATGQGQSSKASRFTFKGLTLEEMKWMGWIPWTNEMDSAAADRLVPIILRKIAEGSAETKDNAVINADGKSEFHNLVGLIDRSSSADYSEVRLSTAATGHDAFDKIDEGDFSKARLDLAPSLRSRGIFVLHTDWQVHLTQITDGEDRPLYLSGGPISFSNGQWSIYGHRVVFTEAMVNEDGASKPFGIFYNPDYLAFGDVGAFSTEQFDQATITADDDGNDIKLADQDMKALRIKLFFDYELSELTVESGGAKLGAFTVLQTAS